MRARFLLTAMALLALATACGSSSEPDTQVLGERVTASDDAADGIIPVAPPVSDAPVATTTSSTTSSTTTTTTTTPPAPPPGPGDLSLALTLERSEVPAESDVVGILTATNPTGATIDITHPDMCETVQGLYQNGQLVSEGIVCAQAVKPDAMPPGETRTWSLRIRTGGLAPGSYEARAGINLTEDVFAAPVPVTITPT